MQVRYQAALRPDRTRIIAAHPTARRFLLEGVLPSYCMSPSQQSLVGGDENSAMFYRAGCNEAVYRIFVQTVELRGQDRRFPIDFQLIDACGE